MWLASGRASPPRCPAGVAACQAEGGRRWHVSFTRVGPEARSNEDQSPHVHILLHCTIGRWARPSLQSRRLGTVPFKQVHGSSPGLGSVRFYLPPKTCAQSVSFHKCHKFALRRNRHVRHHPYPTAIKPSQIMPEIGQLMYPNTRSRAKHIYTEEEVRVVS